MQGLVRTKWFQPLQICVAQGASTGDVHFFESEFDHKSFLLLWEKYLGEMTELIQYSFTSTNWMVLFRAKDARSIETAYLSLRRKSCKAKECNTIKDPARMLSEHFRICLSQYVRLVNHRVGRRGTRVRQRFYKYFVSQLSDYKYIFEQIHQGFQALLQPNAAYEPSEKTYDKEGRLTNWSIYRTSRLYYLFSVGKHRFVNQFRIIHPNDVSVLRNILKKTKTPPILFDP